MKGDEAFSWQRMASPQLENGYTRVANELLEAIARHPFTSHQLRVLLFVLRETYGYGAKSRRLALDYIADGIGMDRAEVSRARSQLFNMGVLWKSQPGTDQQIGIVKDYTRWGNHNVVKSPTKKLGKSQQSTLGNPHPIKKETTKKEIKKDVAPLVLPDWLPQDIWDDWVADRKERRKPLTARAIKGQWKALADWKAQGQDIRAIIQQSIDCGYQGFFPLKSNGNGSKSASDQAYLAQRIAEEQSRRQAAYGAPPAPDFNEDIPF